MHNKLGRISTLEVCFCIDYDFAASVTVFAAKISWLIFNNFAANLLTNSRLFHVFFSNFENLIITKFAALFYDLASNIYQSCDYKDIFYSCTS